MLFQKSADSFHILPEFGINIIGLGFQRSVGVQGQSPDQQDLQSLPCLADVLFKQHENMIKRQG